MIVRDFHVEGVAAFKLETDSPLIVDADAPLALAATPEPLQAIRWGQAQILGSDRCVDLHESHESPTLNIPWDLPG
jgi:hypothetical protein